MRVRYLSVKSPYAKQLDNYPNFHKSGSILGMKKQVYGMNALLVRCGNYIYNVTSNPALYWLAK